MTATRSLRALALFPALAFASCVAPTNPYDEATPPELQVPGRVLGTAAFPTLQGEAPRPPDGIRVWAQLVGAQEAETEVTTADGQGGRFTLEVRPGNYFISADHPAFGQVTAGPVRLSPGAEVNVGVLELRAAEPDASLSGTVVTQGGLSAAGIEVSLVHLLNGTTCGAVEAKTNTTEGGAYTFDAVRPGDYAVVAKTEGATVDVLTGDDAVTLVSEEHTDLDVEGKELLLQPATNVVTVTADGVTGTQTSRSRDLGLDVLGFDGVQQMQIGGDPTFDPALGGTGWQPYSAQIAFTLPDAEGEWPVYVQLRSSCVTSPLYAARVFYDGTPPEIISAQAGTALWDPFSPEPPLVVVGSGLAGVSVTLNVIDATGVDEVRFIVNGDAAATQVEDVEGQPGQALVRATAFIPVDERRYRLRIELTDLAGNTTPLEVAPLFDVLRDVSPPTTPVPVAETFEATGSRALVWLAQRTCPDGGTDWVCEANPHSDGGFLVRGGPDLIDFVPFAQPPFDVRLNDSGTTVIEVIARDAGGQQSPGTARVEVTRPGARTLFTAPEDKEIGLPLAPIYDINTSSFSPPLRAGLDAAPGLYAQGGHAFFSLRHRPETPADTYYSWLIAQPTSAPPVGLVPEGGPHPEGVRKLSVDSSAYNYERYDRTAAALGAGAGGFTWLESWPGYDWFMPQWGRRHLAHANGEGTYDISTRRVTTWDDLDLDGHVAPYAEGDEEACEERGENRCAYDRYAWTALWTQPPAESAFDGRRFVTSGSSHRALELVGSDEGSVTVTGPAMVGVQLADLDNQPYRPVTGLYAPIQAPAGSVLMTGFYTSSSTRWRGQPENDATQFVANVMTGSGNELFRAPEDFVANYSGEVLGIYVPAGVQVEVPLVSVPPVDVVGPVGLVAREFADESEAGQFNKVDATSLDRDDVVPRFTLLLGDRDPMFIGEHNGLTVASWGDDGEPWVATHATAEDLVDVDARVELAEQTAGVLAAEQSAVTEVPTSTGDELYAPTTGCTLIVRAEEDVALRGFSIPGKGIMDYLRIGFWELEGQTPLGIYERTVINPSAQPEQAFLLPSQPEDISDCDDNYVVQSTDQQTGNLTLTEEVIHTQTINATATQVAQQTFSDTNTLVDGEWVIAGSLPISPGQRVIASITSTSVTGDMDAYLGFNGPPTSRTNYDDYSGNYGHDEDFDEVAPGDATNVYIWVYAYPSYGDVDGWAVDMEIVDGTGPFPIFDAEVGLGDVVEVETTGANGDIDIYLTDDGYWPDDYYRERSINAGSNELIEFYVDDDYETHVYIAADHVDLPADYDITVRVKRTQLVQVGSYAVQPGQAVRVDTSGTARSVPYVQFDVEPDAVNYTCTDDLGGYGTTADCTAYAPAGATTAYVAVAPDGEDTDFTADVEIADSGCDEVRIESWQGNGTLRAGRTYAVTISDFIYNDQGPLTWDDRNPAILRGDPLPTDYLTVLGTAPGAYAAGADLVVPSIDTTGPRCQVSFDVISRAQYRSVAAASGAVSAVRELSEPDGTRSVTVVTGQAFDASLTRSTGLTEVESLPAGWDVLDTHVYEGRAYWLQVDETGARASVRSALIGPAQPASCEVAALPTDLVATRAAWSGTQLAVTGLQGGTHQVLLYGLDPSVGACGALATVARRRLPEAALAVAVDGGDLFTWGEPAETGGALRHFDVRDLTPVHPGGSERVLGGDASADEVFVSLHAALDTTAGRLEHLTFADDGALVSAQTLSSGGPYLQPRAVNGGVAYVAPQMAVDGADPSAWLLSSSGGAPVSLDAGGALDDAPAYVAAEPNTWNGTPILESDGSVLALLGFQADGSRRLRIYELPADPTAWGGLVESHDVELDNVSDVVSLSVSGQVVVVTFADVDEPARAFHAASGASGLWEESWVGDRDTERVIGAAAGELLVIEYPGDLFNVRPPAFAPMTTRVPSTEPATPEGLDAPMRVTSSLYLHGFPAVGASADGDVWLFDESAVEPVLWRVDVQHGRAVPADGPRRPLNAGAEQLGVAALPRVSGNQLLFLRGEAAGIALLRERL